MVRRPVAALAAACGALACLAYVSRSLASGAPTPAAELLQRPWQPLSMLQAAELRQRQSLLAAGAPGPVFSADFEVGVDGVVSRGRGLECESWWVRKPTSPMSRVCCSPPPCRLSQVPGAGAQRFRDGDQLEQALTSVRRRIDSSHAQLVRLSGPF
jgi:hypothetical protein